MNLRSSFSRLFHSPIPLGAAVMLVALAWDGLAASAAHSKSGTTKIHEAEKAGDLGKVKKLLKHNPALVFSKADEYTGGTPLHVAAGYGQKDVAELLLDFKAVVDAKNKNGYSPLYVAARSGHRDVVELLLAHGADINAKDNAGQTPLDAVLYQIINHPTLPEWPDELDVTKLLVRLGATSQLTNQAELAEIAEPDARKLAEDRKRASVPGTVWDYLASLKMPGWTFSKEETKVIIQTNDTVQGKATAVLEVVFKGGSGKGVRFNTGAQADFGPTIRPRSGAPIMLGVLVYPDNGSTYLVELATFFLVQDGDTWKILGMKPARLRTPEFSPM